MKNVFLGTVLLASILAAPAVRAQGTQTETVSDSFPGSTRNNVIWRDSIYADNTARFAVTNGRVLLSRNTQVPDSTQIVMWDARFVRLYDNDDYLEIGATVRMPHKLTADGAAVSIGLGLVGDGAQLIELRVEDSVDGRQFVIYGENLDTDTPQTFTFDAPQNVTVFDVFIAYSAISDTLAFYWSVPGLDRLFRIGQITDFSFIGGTAPRRIRPYIIGVMSGSAAVYPFWKVTLDNFYAYRENAP